LFFVKTILIQFFIIVPSIMWIGVPSLPVLSLSSEKVLPEKLCIRGVSRSLPPEKVWPEKLCIGVSRTLLPEMLPNSLLFSPEKWIDVPKILG